MSVTASVAHLLIGQRHPVGLYVNGGMAGSKGFVELPPGSSQEQLIRILELLAGVEPIASCPLETLLAEVAPRLPWGSGVVVVAGSLPEPLLAALQTTRRSGRRPAILHAGDDLAPEGCDGIPIYSMPAQHTRPLKGAVGDGLRLRSWQ